MGFQLELTEVDSATLNQLQYGGAPAEERPHFFGGWSWWPDYNDPWNMLAPNFLEASTGEGGANAGYWVNERFEEIMAEAETYTDEEQLVALMKEAQNILTEQDPPAIYYGQLQWYTSCARTFRASTTTRSTLAPTPTTRCLAPRRRSRGVQKDRRVARQDHCARPTGGSAGDDHSPSPRCHQPPPWRPPGTQDRSRSPLCAAPLLVAKPSVGHGLDRLDVAGTDRGQNHRGGGHAVRIQVAPSTRSPMRALK